MFISRYERVIDFVGRWNCLESGKCENFVHRALPSRSHLSSGFGCWEHAYMRLRGPLWSNCDPHRLLWVRLRLRGCVWWQTELIAGSAVRFSCHRSHSSLSRHPQAVSPLADRKPRFALTGLLRLATTRGSVPLGHNSRCATFLSMLLHGVMLVYICCLCSAILSSDVVGILV